MSGAGGHQTGTGGGQQDLGGRVVRQLLDCGQGQEPRSRHRRHDQRGQAEVRHCDG